MAKKTAYETLFDRSGEGDGMEEFEKTRQGFIDAGFPVETPEQAAARNAQSRRKG
jgi:hypothetical protein